jgi:hypothetical protein
MADRPILFSSPMVRALFAGTKTQTRRVLNPQPLEWQAKVIDILPPSQDDNGNWGQVETVWSGPLVPGMCEPDHEEWHPIRHHRVGDRLYVREQWRPGYDAEGWREDLGRVARPSDFDPHNTAIEYLADGTHELGGDNRPGIHMPRWASRLTLYVTNVRVERLQEISDEDANAEGVVLRPSGLDYWVPGVEHPNKDFPYLSRPTAREMYAALWDIINGSGSWGANPWVVAYSFTVALGNIDALAEAA